MKYVITEAEKRKILGLYGIVREEIRPLQMVEQFKFTTDGRFFIYEGIGYSCETGEQVPISEAWSLSDILHAAGDVSSMVADFIVPGTGAFIDGLNAFTYLVEAYFQKDPKKKHSLLVMAAITGAFAIIPGALQLASIPLKRFVKTGIMAKGVKEMGLISRAIKAVSEQMGKITAGMPALLQRILNSNFGKKHLAKYAEWLTTNIGKISKAMSESFNDFAANMGKSGARTATKSATKAAVRGAESILDMPIHKALLAFFTGRGFRKKLVNGPKLLRKLGFVKEMPYKFFSKTAKGDVGVSKIVIKDITDKEVSFIYRDAVFNKGQLNVISHEDFLRNAVGAPWLHRGKSRYVPLFVKRLADWILPDGSGIDESKLDQFPDTDPQTTSNESMAYLEDEIAAYQGDKGQYTSDPNVMKFQQALMSLGYNLPQYGIDGKFGPETQTMLKKFQSDNNLESSSGKMDRLTAKTMSTQLKNKNVPDSEQLQNDLNSI